MSIDALATMVSLFTQGCDPSDEDIRWIDEQMILPAVPTTAPGSTSQSAQTSVRRRVVFVTDDLFRVGSHLCRQLVRGAGLTVWALTVQPWYAHVVIKGPAPPASQFLAWANQAVKEALGLRPPVWSPQCVSRYCFEPASVQAWIAYVEQHNLAAGWSARPWEEISEYHPG